MTLNKEHMPALSALAVILAYAAFTFLVGHSTVRSIVLTMCMTVPLAVLWATAHRKGYWVGMIGMWAPLYIVWGAITYTQLS